MGKSAVRAAVPAPENTKEPIRKAPEDAFARAVAIIGGEKKTASRTSLLQSYIHDVLFNDSELVADFCPEIERAARGLVKCEELRPDLIWHRDGAGEVLGYSHAIDGASRKALEEFLASSGQNILGRGSNETRAESSTTKEVLSHLFGQDSHGTWWRNVALTQFSDGILAHADDETARTIANSCENILYAIEHGLAAGNKVLWSALQSGWTNTPEVLDLTYFLSTMGEYAIELRGLKSNLQFQLKDATL